MRTQNPVLPVIRTSDGEIGWRVSAQGTATGQAVCVSGERFAAHDATVEEVRAGRKRVTENTATKAHLRAVLDVLAGRQADNVALEKGGLGLLMRALLVDGITRWQADYKPRDQAILLTEWLTFGVERVPRLYEEMKDGRMRGTFDLRELAESRTQQPALFDFARRRREVVLARQP